MFHGFLGFDHKFKRYTYYFRKINNNYKNSNSSSPGEISINHERYTLSEDIASKLNEYFPLFQILLAAITG